MRTRPLGGRDAGRMNEREVHAVSQLSGMCATVLPLHSMSASDVDEYLPHRDKSRRVCQLRVRLSGAMRADPRAGRVLASTGGHDPCLESLNAFHALSCLLLYLAPQRAQGSLSHELF